MCPNFDEPMVNLSIDGVQECRSNSVSLEVFSIKFPNCRNVYPLKIIRPVNKFLVNYKPHLRSILQSMAESNIFLKHFIGDNPKRSMIREALCHSSSYACEYCISKAESYTEKNVKMNEEKKQNNLKIKQYELQIKNLRQSASSTTGLQEKKEQIMLLEEVIGVLRKRNAHLCKRHSHVVWPASTRNGEARTKENVLAIVDSLNEHGRSQLSADDVKGITGRSLLLDLDYFDFVNGVPTEYMHLGCLGVVKR